MKKKILLSTVLVMSLNSVNAFEVVATSSKNIQSNEFSSPYSVEIYTQKDIKNSSATNIYEFLNLHTSITTFPNYGNVYQQNFSFRGYSMDGGYENVAIIVDGRKINSIDMSPQILSAIPLDSIEKIEITKGGGSVEAGDGANAAVINITTKTAQKISLNSTFGSNDYLDSSIGGGFIKNNLIFSVFANKNKDDGNRKINSQGDKDKKEKSSYLAKIEYLINKNIKINAGYNYGDLEVNYAPALTKTEFEDDPSKLGSSGSASKLELDTKTLNYGFDWIGKNLRFEIQAYSNKKTNDNITYNFTSEYESKNIVSKLHYKNKNLSTVLGYEKVDNERKQTSATTSKDSLSNFINIAYDIANIKLFAGYRNEIIDYEYLPSNKAKLSDDEKLSAYEVGANYKLVKQNLFLSIMQNHIRLRI